MSDIICIQCSGTGYTSKRVRKIAWTEPCDRCHGKGRLSMNDAIGIMDEVEDEQPRKAE